MDIRNWFKPKRSELADLLSSSSLQEDLLGVKKMDVPTPDRIKTDTNKIVSYSRSAEYKVFAQEAWARVLTHLDVIQDASISIDKLNYHRGALKEALDLLRLSYQALSVKEQVEKEQTKKTSLPFSR